MDSFDPGVEVALRSGDVALVGCAGIIDAESHGAFGERTVDRMFAGRAKADPFVSESGLNTGGDHRVKFTAGGFITDAVFQVAIGADPLHRGKTTAFVMYARYSVPREHLGDVGDARDLAVKHRHGLPLPHSIENAIGVVGNAAVERSFGISVERAARRVRGLVVDARHFKGFGVVKGSVAAAMANADRVVPGNLIEVVDGKLPPVLHFS